MSNFVYISASVSLVQKNAKRERDSNTVTNYITTDLLA